MAKKIYYCENHPDVVANETCHQCGKRICYNCIQEAFDHLFCSMQCVGIFLAKEFVKAVFYLFRGIVFLLLWPFRQLLRSSHRSIIELVLAIGLLVCFYFIRQLTVRVKTLDREPITESVSNVSSDTLAISPPEIFQPTEGGMIHSNTIDIVGEAEDNRIVTLSIDGKLKYVLLPENNRFTFENIRLHRGDNRMDVKAITEDGKVSTLQTLVLNYANPTLGFLARDFQRGSLTGKQIALTFDGGSINNVADEILDILKEKKLKSTFFLTGAFIRHYPQTVKRIVAEGHEVGNHTWTHPHLTTFAENGKHITLSGVTEETLHSEFEMTASLFKTITGNTMKKMWRAPYGEYNKEILQWAANAGYKHVAWTAGQGWEESMDTMDWVADKESKAYHSAEEIVEKILNYGKRKKDGSSGVVILMHLGSNRKDDFPHKRLPEIIDGFREKGYNLVPVSEMIANG